MPSTKIPLGQYIFRRIQQLGIQHIFGCPGDFNLNLLDHLYETGGLKWVGNCNELNAAYAADGYGRSRGGLPGVVITTFCVGELSAINGIGGAYAEFIPIIHIVGTTSRAAQAQRLMIHHVLEENWDHTTLQTVSKAVSTATAFLTDDATFIHEVDRVIETSVKTRRPVYLYVPMDVPDLLVDADQLDQPLDLSIRNVGQEGLEDAIVAKILAELERATKPCLLVDALTQRYTVTNEVQQILQLTQLPAFVTPLGKSSVDESYQNFVGLYQGAITPSPAVRESIEGSDLVIHVGRFPTDSNTGGWSGKIQTANTIVLHPEYVSVRDENWRPLSFVPIIKKLARALKEKQAIQLPEKWWKSPLEMPLDRVAEFRGPLRQSDLWKVFNRFLRKDDCLIAEVGTSQFGSFGMRLPANSEYYSQLFYSSIGFTVPAALGSLIARKELNRRGRVILFVGDGSLQMTVQEVGTMIRLGFHPTIVVINNDGYTVERVIHGPAKPHNDVSPWNYQLMLRFFGGPEESRSFSARTYEELIPILDDEEFQSSKQIQVLECFLHKYDSPALLSNLVDLSASRMEWSVQQEDKRYHRSRVNLDGTLTQSGLSRHIQL